MSHFFFFFFFYFSSLSTSSKPDMSDSATVLEAFKFIESAAAEFSDEDEEEDSEGRDKTILDLAAVRREHAPGPSDVSAESSPVSHCHFCHRW